MSLDGTFHARAGHSEKRSHRGNLDASRDRLSNNRTSNRMLGRTFHRRCKPQDIIDRRSGFRCDISDFQLPDGECSRFVEHNMSRLSDAFERLRISNENPSLACSAGPHHHSHRSCQTQSTRAGNNQHSDGRNNTGGQISGRPPAQYRDHRKEQYSRHKHRRNPVCQTLHRRTAGLSLLNQISNPRDCGVAAIDCGLNN